MPDFHRLDPDADAVFLRRSAADPLSRVAFRPTNAVVLCATCGLVSLRETWEACGGCPNGHTTAAAWDPARAAQASGDGARRAAALATPVAAAPLASAPDERPFPEERPRRTGLWIALGVGALLLAVLAAVALLNRDDAPETTVVRDTAAGPAAPVAVAAEVGEVEGTLDDGDFQTPDGYYQDVYTFAADSSNRTLTFTVESEDFYPDLVVRGPDGRDVEAETLTPGADEPSNLRRVSVRNVRGPGEYRLLLTSRQPSATGTYTLRIRQEEVVVALPTTGRQLNGELTARSPRTGPSYHDTYSFEGAANREHTITVRSGVFTPTLVVTGPAGAAVRGETAPASGGTVFRFTPDRAGSYRAVVSTREAGRTGAYTIALALGPAPPAPVAANPDAGASTGLRAGAAPVRDSLAAGDQRTYVVAGRIGDRVSVEVRADGFTPTLTVVSPDGQRTPATPDGDRARVSVTLPSDGRFRVIVGSTGGAGGYSVSLEQRAAVTAAPIPRLPGADQPAPPPPEGEYRPQPLGGNN